MANRISAIFDIETKGGIRSLGDLRTELRNTEGIGNKAKVALGGVGDYLKANMVEGALAAGTAVVAFGVKSVQAFTDTALSAGKLADATGLTVEESSRWLEVAGDVGITGEQLTSMFARLERSIGANPDKMRALGIEMERNADGSVNMTDTMLAAIDAIKAIEDPTERAKVSQETFGRSYTEVAELIEAGAGNVRQALDDVSEAKVIDQEELDKARDLRASMDNLKDSVEDVALMFGEYLAPEVAETADNLVWLKENIEKLAGVDGFGAIAGAVEDAVNPLGFFNNIVSKAREELGGATEEVKGFDGAAARAQTRTRRLADDVSDLGDETDETTEAFKELKGELSDEQAFISLARAYESLSDSGQRSALEQREAILSLKSQLLDYAEQVGNIPPERVTRLLAEIDQGSLEEVERLLGILSRNRFVRISATGVTGGVAIDGPNTSRRTTTANNDATGNYNTEGPRTINDGLGPELVQLPNGSKVMTAANTRNHLRGSAPVVQPIAYHFHTHNNRIVATGSPGQVAAAMSRRVRGRS